MAEPNYDAEEIEDESLSRKSRADKIYFEKVQPGRKESVGFQKPNRLLVMILRFLVFSNFKIDVTQKLSCDSII